MPLESDFYEVIERLKETLDFSPRPIERIIGIERLSRRKDQDLEGVFIRYVSPQSINHPLFKFVDLFQAEWGAPWRGLVVLHVKEELNIDERSAVLHLGRGSKRHDIGAPAPGYPKTRFEEFRHTNGCILRFCQRMPGYPITLAVVENLTGNPKT